MLFDFGRHENLLFPAQKYFENASVDPKENEKQRRKIDNEGNVFYISTL